MTNAKKKGNAGENAWSNWLNDQGIRSWKDSQSGGGNREKSDTGNNINCHFEVKTVKNLSIQKAWQKAVRDANKQQNTPHLVVHYNGMPKDEWFIIMNNWDWLNLIKRPEDEMVVTENRNLKWQLKILKENINKVLRELDKIN